MNALIIARKEIHQAVRNRWVLASTLLLAGLSLSLTFLGSAPTGTGLGSRIVKSMAATLGPGLSHLETPNGTIVEVPLQILTAPAARN